jgi:uncharacterized membrane protein YqjE
MRIPNEAQMNAEKSSAQQAMEGRPVASWASIFLDYFEFKARLFAVESKEASSHFIKLLVILAAILVLAGSSFLMYEAFLLYLIAYLFHLAWGWSALICGAILTASSIVAFFVFRLGLGKPVFQMTLRDIQKDKEWLSRSKTKTS